MQLRAILPKLKPVYLLWLLAPLLVWLALKDIDWAAVAAAIQRLSPWQIATLVLLNILTLLSFSGIWYLVLLGYGRRVPYIQLSLYRVASFGVSYFTPGPQFGGEPLQVHLLVRNHQLPLALATAATLLDKVLELFFNFLFLAFGLLLVVGYQAPAVYGLLATAFLGLTAFFVAEWRGLKPLTRLSARALAGWNRQPRVQHGLQVLAETEDLVGGFCRTQPRLLLMALGISLVSWALVLIEYWLTLKFLGLGLSLFQLVVAVTINRLAFLAPLPGGLGALEGSQVLAMTTLGLNPALGVSQALIIRARDILVGLAGLWVGWRAGRSPRLRLPTDE